MNALKMKATKMEKGDVSLKFQPLFFWSPRIT